MGGRGEETMSKRRSNKISSSDDDLKFGEKPTKSSSDNDSDTDSVFEGKKKKNVSKKRSSNYSDNEFEAKTKKNKKETPKIINETPKIKNIETSEIKKKETSEIIIEITEKKKNLEKKETLEDYFETKPKSDKTLKKPQNKPQIKTSEKKPQKKTSKKKPQKNTSEKKISEPEKKNVIIEIIEHWGIKLGPTGAWEKAVDTYNKAIELSDTWTDKELENIFDIDVWQYLYKHRICTNKLQTIKIDKQDIYRKWIELSKLNECLIYNKNKLDTYATKTIRTLKSSGQHFPLYQMPIRISEYIEKGTLIQWSNDTVASHLCHTKNCLKCVVKESKLYNSHRNYCIAFTLVDTKLKWICQHNPQCKIFGKSAYFK